MKIDELLKRLENIKIDEDELVDISLLKKIKRKEDVIHYILDTLTKTTNIFNSIIYINNGVVKYFSRSIDGSGVKNIIIKDNKAYEWFSYEVRNSTIIVYNAMVYTVNKYVVLLLDTLPETPIDNAYQSYRNLYRYLRQGYNIIL